VDYDTVPRDSTTHFALAGFDHHLTEHLLINVLGGESFRSFQNDGDTINPYAEVRVNYLASNHSLTWITTYGVEQATQSLASGTTAIRTGLNATYDLTSRIKATAGLYYHNSENQGSSGTGSAGSQEALQFTLGLRYTINKHFAAHVHYDYTAQNSSGGQAGYSRNQYFAGLTYHY
jgi:predicted porin